jgi:hypothetical protein
MGGRAIVRGVLYGALALLTALAAWTAAGASGARQDAAMIVLAVGLAGLLAGTQRGRPG